MAETTLEYLQEMSRSVGSATLLEVRQEVDGTQAVVLDRTIFYPQGGGQACDTGVIEATGFRFQVQSVTYSQGTVLHAGRVLEGTPPVSAEVTLIIDRARRQYNSRLQSGGHLLLNAMQNIGQPLVATKGYHFPDGPYVEFAGMIPEAERDTALTRLQAEVDRLTALDLPVTWQFVPADRLREVCKNVPVNVPTDKPTRVVTIDGLSQPCGGTHVSSLGDLKGMRVEKVRAKKGLTRVSYSVPNASASQL